MERLIKSIPKHIRLKGGEELKYVPNVGEFRESDYEYSVELPHLITHDDAMMNHSIKFKGDHIDIIVKRTDEINEGDVIINEYGFSAKVKTIIERRPARGDWSSNSFDSKPDFIRIAI
jgi:hypothetical protein